LDSEKLEFKTEYRQKVDDLSDSLEKQSQEMVDLKFENQRLQKFKQMHEAEDESFLLEVNFSNFFLYFCSFFFLKDLAIKYKELLIEKEQILYEFNTFKEGAIGTILEKEREIEDLSLKVNNEMLDELLKEREQLFQEKEDAKRRLLTMEQELEKDHNENEETKLNLEQEVNQQVSLKLKDQLERNKDFENNLIEELRKSDEKILNYEMYIKELEKKQGGLEEEIHKQKSPKNESFLNSNQNQNNSEDSLKLTQKYEKIIEELKRNQIEITSLKEGIITKNELDFAELNKKNEGLEKDNKKFLENQNLLKQKIEGLEEKIQEMMKEFEERMDDKEHNSALEKQVLEKEVIELKEEIVIDMFMELFIKRMYFFRIRIKTLFQARII